jgi:multidrug efflux system outer membrane protein
MSTMQKEAQPMNKLILISLAPLVALAGCTLAPSYKRPESPVARDWPDNSSAQASARVAADLGWKEFFLDARLRQIVQLALDNNRDLRVAALNVEQVRAQYRIQRAALLPALNATGSGSRSRTPGSLTGSGEPVISSTYAVTAGVTAYELDLFGRVRSLNNKALEAYLATEETRRSFQLTLVAEVAVQYYTQRAISEELQLAVDTLAAVSASHDLTRRSYELGKASDLDFQSAEIQLQTARANVANYRQQLAAADTALVLLTGCPIPSGLPAPEALAASRLLSDLAPGLPSDLLQRRPDILAAEHVLKAANANIGAARAAFFPKITLTGSTGTASTELSGLFKAGTQSWNFAPSISLPLFAGGSNKAALDVANLGKRIEVATYEKAIQTAFKEVADALSARAQLDERLSAYVALVAAQEKRFAFAEARYRQGVDSYLDVLTAQQDLFTARQTLIAMQLARLSNQISLFKALGGAWK